MWGAAVKEKKRSLRTAALSQRSALSPEECLARSESIQRKALSLDGYIAASAVALYSPVQNEVLTDRIFSDALGARKQVFYPKMDRPGMLQLVEVASAGDLQIGRYEIPEPKGDRQFWQAAGKRVVFVPGVLFDTQGNRLGRGAGWYDRLLGELDGQATFVGLAYEIQLIDEVPTERWDRKVHFIITENRLIECAQTSIQPIRAP
jgi:5-formyltetrahydrofolate cyclo-ligase